MDIFRKIADRKIEQAIARGEFDNLPSSGKPIDLDDCSLVPEESRMVFRVLKNANVLPEEVQLKQQMQSLRAALEVSDDSEKRRELIRRYNQAESQYNLLLERYRRGRGL